jgi:hypothetical protein
MFRQRLVMHAIQTRNTRHANISEGRGQYYNATGELVFHEIGSTPLMCHRGNLTPSSPLSPLSAPFPPRTSPSIIPMRGLVSRLAQGRVSRRAPSQESPTPVSLSCSTSPPLSSGSSVTSTELTDRAGESVDSPSAAGLPPSQAHDVAKDSLGSKTHAHQFSHDDDEELWSVFNDLSFEDVSAADTTTAQDDSISLSSQATSMPRSPVKTPTSQIPPQHIHISQTIHIHEPSSSPSPDPLPGIVPMGEELRAALALLTADPRVFEVVSDMIRFDGEVEHGQWPQVLHTAGFEDVDVTRLITLMHNDPTRLHERSMRTWRRQNMHLASKIFH